ncbi:MucB/RseB C-terminal domain-containing protein [Pseudomonas sp.]|uniref:MucB/RseB C-terminal domain-containing protein n=1 Tax=Pseudomonas sp. TaxID=306 RepID=UPI003D0E5E91
MRVLPLYVVLGGWLAMPALAADAGAWMDRLAAAEQKQSYAGTFVYERNGSFSSHAVWQRVDGGRVQERLLQLDGPPAEVVRVDGQMQCATDELATQFREAQAWRGQRLDPKALSEWYEFRVIGDSRVAGRPAVALAVSARDQHRYGFELHLDRETALPLKSLMLNEKGQLLERFQFTRFTADPVDAQLLKPGEACKAISVVAREAAPESAWRSDWLPPGFVLLDANVRPSPASSETVSWLSYGDGLAKFSVFLEPLRGALVEDARSQMGPTVAVSKRISTADGDVMVTVVGEIPLGTAERVALSMRAGAEQAQR